jgi:hypothetical protein
MRIKGQMGPFIYNNRVVGEEADKLLKEMKFNTSFIWRYDPSGIIVEMRSKNKSSPYAHTLKPEIKKYVNPTEWEVNTLVDIEPQESLSLSISPTSSPQIPKEKRPRKDDSPSITEVSSEEFQVYNKKPKTTLATHMSSEEEPYFATVIERRPQVVSTSSSKKQT